MGGEGYMNKTLLAANHGVGEDALTSGLTVHTPMKSLCSPLTLLASDNFIN